MNYYYYSDTVEVSTVNVIASIVSKTSTGSSQVDRPIAFTGDSTKTITDVNMDQLELERRTVSGGAILSRQLTWPTLRCTSNI